MKKKSDTIYAPATLVGESSITVFRISGINAFDFIVNYFCKDVNVKQKISKEKIRGGRNMHGFIFSEESIIDEVVVSFFRSPHSFTGEDLVEISSHGGVATYRALIQTFNNYGLRQAGTGEFSRRAVMNGKMDIIQAEAISDLIRSETEIQGKQFLSQATGQYTKAINAIRSEIINYCSLLELEIDFTGEGIELVNKEKLIGHLDTISTKIEQMHSSYEKGIFIKNGIKVAIIGPPNAGKSSLFNALLEKNRSIVTNTPGTTRDFIEDYIFIKGVKLILQDTAGIHKSKEKIEKKGIKTSEELLRKADIVLLVIDSQNQEMLTAFIKGSKKRIIKVLNKIDLNKAAYEFDACISVKTGENLENIMKLLEQEVKRLVDIPKSSLLVVTNERHKIKLLKVCQYLGGVKTEIEKDSIETACIELRNATKEMDEILGKITSEEILNNIFENFCIGK